mgnify:CR=1 FL=1
MTHSHQYELMVILDPEIDERQVAPKLDGFLKVITGDGGTIENVDVVDATHIIVGNDNNLPFSSSREPNKADDNEFILLDVRDFLQAR